MTAGVPHLLVYISGHGFGHVSQVAPVLNALRERLDIRLTICSTVPRQHLQSRIAGEFFHIEAAADFGMVMASALDVLPQPSMQAYIEFHRDWPQRVALEAQRITELSPDMVLTNVAYLPLQAAHGLGIPCAAMCSLNWLDIFWHYCAKMEGATRIRDEVWAAYAAADMFLRVTPAMPMTALPNVQLIAPVARMGNNRRDEINDRLSLAADEKLVLVSMGGIAMRLPVERWPALPGVRWIIQADWQVSRPDVIALESLEMGFVDVLASSDALLCKPGYGSFTEAGCNGVPVLYAAREDWPEEPHLINWLESRGRCRRVQRQALESGEFGMDMHAWLSQPKPEAVKPLGVSQAVDYLQSRLRLTVKHQKKTIAAGAQSTSHRHN